MKIELTTHWPIERVSAVWPDVIRCLTMFCDRFPRDETVENLVRQILTGALQLWVIKSGGKFRGVLVTRIQTSSATGKVQIQVPVIAGKGFPCDMSGLADIEAWGRDQHGAEELEIIGRKGWSREMVKLGYRNDLYLYRKPLRATQ